MSNLYLDNQPFPDMRLQLSLQALQPHLWGVRSVQWDEAALQSNCLRLNALSAIFRHGGLCDAPANDPLPPAVDLGALPAGLREVTYYAALPMAAPNSGTHAPGEAPGQRKVVRLLSHLEAHVGYECFPLLRLRRDASGTYAPDPSFVPPSLSVAHAPRLKAQLERLVIALQAKADALRTQMQERQRNTAGITAADVAAFCLLQCVSAAGATLTHYLRHPAPHPERLFEAMLALAGTLMSYSRAGTPASLPTYQHEQPGPCLEQLGGIVRTQLDAAMSPCSFSIALTEERPCYYAAALEAGRIGRGTTLYLAVGSAMPEAELAELAPLRIKAGAPDDVERCVQFAMQGVKLSYAPRLPAAVAAQPGACYFALDSTGTLYEQMISAEAISIYVPAGIDGLRLELIVVTQ
jgi:type VI secretion system protein ImpJ